ncbi:hypothetical protein VNO77_21777 [Canavalia gladiata]|uniref:Uncharacterized protein n=1 Tax=Canavalia gladiata TaxID=3824 RepID=A0AAN9L1U5_CANGL
MDIYIWYTIISEIVGGVIAEQARLGEICSIEMVHKRFESFPGVFVKKFCLSINKKDPLQCTVNPRFSRYEQSAAMKSEIIDLPSLTHNMRLSTMLCSFGLLHNGPCYHVSAPIHLSQAARLPYYTPKATSIGPSYHNQLQLDHESAAAYIELLLMETRPWVSCCLK